VNRVSSGRRTMEVLADDPRSNPGSTSDVLLYHRFEPIMYILKHTCNGVMRSVNIRIRNNRVARVESSCIYSEPQNTESRQGKANKLEVVPDELQGGQD